MTSAEKVEGTAGEVVRERGGRYSLLTVQAMDLESGLRGIFKQKILRRCRKSRENRGVRRATGRSGMVGPSKGLL